MIGEEVCGYISCSTSRWLSSVYAFSFWLPFVAYSRTPRAWVSHSSEMVSSRASLHSSRYLPHKPRDCLEATPNAQSLGKWWVEPVFLDGLADAEHLGESLWSQVVCWWSWRWIVVHKRAVPDDFKASSYVYKTRYKVVTYVEITHQDISYIEITFNFKTSCTTNNYTLVLKLCTRYTDNEWAIHTHVYYDGDLGSYHKASQQILSLSLSPFQSSPFLPHLSHACIHSLTVAFSLTHTA